MLKKGNFFFAILFGLIIGFLTTAFPQSFTRVKCPASGMTFTQGLPVRVLADGEDINAWQYLDHQNEAAEVRFFADGVQKAVDGHSRGYNHFEAILTDLVVGNHFLTTQSLNFGNVILNSAESVFIAVAPMPAKSKTVSLSADILLSGNQNLDWQDAIVQGNGYKVTSANNWTGSIIIKNCFVTGLAVTGAVIPDTAVVKAQGIDVSTQGGSVTLENTVFEWTGGQRYDVNGGGAVSVKGCEFRASAFIAYDSSNPERSPFLEFSGNATGTKVFQSSNVGAGYLYIHNMKGWLIGGNSDAESNVFIGPRTGPRVEFSQDIQIRGNYSHHDYKGGWSQGFNFWFYDNTGVVLTEHNVISEASWPVQSLSGEFRYNLVVHCGHEWVRTALTGTSIHHNVFIEPSSPGNPNAGIWMYENQTGVNIYNNTFDGGGSPDWLPSPAVAVSKGSMISKLTNNVFTGFANDSTVGIVDRYLSGGENDSVARIVKADYNCFYNPKGRKPNNYGNFLVSGVSEGAAGYGGHDLGGVNGQVAPKFKLGMDTSFGLNEADVWNRVKTVSQVLAEYRNRYMPNAGSPLIDAGDPADGQGVDIGAVGAGTADPADLFGKFGAAATIYRDIKRGNTNSPAALLKSVKPGETAIFRIDGRKIGDARIMRTVSGIKLVLQNGLPCGPGIYLIRIDNARQSSITRIVSTR
jgi:hypothetical protein